MVKIRILIVEDEALLALSVQRLLNRLGYDAFGVAASGDEAVETARRERPDLIMMDIHLRGEMDGIQVAERIRDFLDVPIVYTTAFSDEETVERAKKTEPSAFLLKPYDTRDLQVTIEISYHRYRAERRIRENEQRISTILRCIDDSVVTTDNSGAVTFMNPNAERLTGWMGGEAAGKRVDEVLPLSPETSAQARLPAGTPAENGDQDDRFRGFRVLENRNGDVIPVECVVTPLTEEWGGTSGRVFVLRDLTAVRREEEEKRRIEAELAQSQKMEAVGRFAAGTAHDFNQYLAVIMGSLELQERTNGRMEVPSEELRIALDAVEKAAGLTRNLIQFSRKKPIQMVELDVNAAIENFMVLARCIMSARIRTVIELDPDRPRIWADPIQFEQILMNIVINARDAMPSGGRLTIRTARMGLDPGNAGCTDRPVRITISDSGNGAGPGEIPPGENPVLSRKSGGTGFGMFIVHEAVRRHGGVVFFESGSGRGTTVYIDMPEFGEIESGTETLGPESARLENITEQFRVCAN
jgi:two-component system cell cycle sensor histidine kinase/response regulator CckA